MGTLSSTNYHQLPQHSMFLYYHQEPTVSTLSQLAKPPALPAYVKTKKKVLLLTAPSHVCGHR